MCIEREKDNFKSREVNCLKECALALKLVRTPLNNLLRGFYTLLNRLYGVIHF